MGKLSKEEMIAVLEENISHMEKKDFNVYFFVLDTKGNHSGSIEYIYSTALMIKELGYNVTMIHNEKDFIGVSQWLGNKYDVLPHKNVEEENVEINKCDFLFIPEIFTNVMSQTKKLPCKKVMLVQNYNYLSEFMPVGVVPSDYGISEIVTTTNAQREKILEMFPEVSVHVVSPSIDEKFRASKAPKKLIVNIYTKDQSDVNKIVKPFYWRYPIYKWVSFRDLRGITQDAFCEALRESAITVICDPTTNFGYATLEAIRCGNVVVSKLPEHLSDWNTDSEGVLMDGCIWFDDIDELPKMLSSLIRTWTRDEFPNGFTEAYKKYDKLYTKENALNDINAVYVKGIFEKRNNEFKEVMTQLKNNLLDIE